MHANGNKRRVVAAIHSAKRHRSSPLAAAAALPPSPYSDGSDNDDDATDDDSDALYADVRAYFEAHLFNLTNEEWQRWTRISSEKPACFNDWALAHVAGDEELRVRLCEPTPQGVFATFEHVGGVRQRQSRINMARVVARDMYENIRCEFERHGLDLSDPQDALCALGVDPELLEAGQSTFMGFTVPFDLACMASFEGFERKVEAYFRPSCEERGVAITCLLLSLIRNFMYYDSDDKAEDATLRRPIFFEGIFQLLVQPDWACLLRADRATLLAQFEAWLTQEETRSCVGLFSCLLVSKLTYGTDRDVEGRDKEEKAALRLLDQGHIAELVDYLCKLRDETAGRDVCHSSAILIENELQSGKTMVDIVAGIVQAMRHEQKFIFKVVRDKGGYKSEQQFRTQDMVTAKRKLKEAIGMLRLDDGRGGSRKARDRATLNWYRGCIPEIDFILTFPTQGDLRYNLKDYTAAAQQSEHQIFVLNSNTDRLQPLKRFLEQHPDVKVGIHLDEADAPHTDCRGEEEEARSAKEGARATPQQLFREIRRLKNVTSFVTVSATPETCAHSEGVFDAVLLIKRRLYRGLEDLYQIHVDVAGKRLIDALPHMLRKSLEVTGLATWEHDAAGVASIETRKRFQRERHVERAKYETVDKDRKLLTFLLRASETSHNKKRYEVAGIVNHMLHKVYEQNGHIVVVENEFGHQIRSDDQTLESLNTLFTDLHLDPCLQVSADDEIHDDQIKLIAQSLGKTTAAYKQMASVFDSSRGEAKAVGRCRGEHRKEVGSHGVGRKQRHFSTNLCDATYQLLTNVSLLLHRNDTAAALGAAMNQVCQQPYLVQSWQTQFAENCERAMTLIRTEVLAGADDRHTAEAVAHWCELCLELYGDVLHMVARPWEENRLRDALETSDKAAPVLHSLIEQRHNVSWLVESLQFDPAALISSPRKAAVTRVVKGMLGAGRDPPPRGFRKPLDNYLDALNAAADEMKQRADGFCISDADLKRQVETQRVLWIPRDESRLDTKGLLFILNQQQARVGADRKACYLLPQPTDNRGVTVNGVCDPDDTAFATEVCEYFFNDREVKKMKESWNHRLPLVGQLMHCIQRGGGGVVQNEIQSYRVCTRVGSEKAKNEKAFIITTKSDALAMTEHFLTHYNIVQQLFCTHQLHAVVKAKGEIYRTYSNAKAQRHAKKHTQVATRSKMLELVAPAAPTPPAAAAAAPTPAAMVQSFCTALVHIQRRRNESVVGESVGEEEDAATTTTINDDGIKLHHSTIVTACAHVFLITHGRDLTRGFVYTDVAKWIRDNLDVQNALESAIVQVGGERRRHNLVGRDWRSNNGDRRHEWHDRYTGKDVSGENKALGRACKVGSLRAAVSGGYFRENTFYLS